MDRFWWIIFSLLSGQAVLAQGHIPVFPDLEGPELLDQVVDAYKTQTTLSSNDSKDTLYGHIYKVGDSLRCVYTGYTIYLDPSADPSEAAFDQDINLEHTFPKSMGAGLGLPLTDMHHLHPSRVEANTARGSLPFGEVPDAQADEWFYLDQTLSGPPAQNIDAYSEVQHNVFFEPREDHKGNVARAVFYFYTMYKTEADAANSSFFESQRLTLCGWHLVDPVDELEWERTFLIGQYQDGKPNPYVLDCTLATRTFCQDLGVECTPLVDTWEPADRQIDLLVQPNPASGQVLVHWSEWSGSVLTLALHDGRGLRVRQLEVPPGQTQTELSLADLPPGMYYLEWRGERIHGGRMIVVQ